jgi:hypothetical protein
MDPAMPRRFSAWAIFRERNWLPLSAHIPSASDRDLECVDGEFGGHPIGD